MRTFTVTNSIHAILILTVKQSSSALLEANGEWTSGCQGYLPIFESASHHSCDDSNCQSARLEVTWKSKLQIPSFCHRHIVIAPDPTGLEMCYRNPACYLQSKDKFTRTPKPQQKAFAGLKESALDDAICQEHKKKKKVTIGEDSTCDIAGCQCAHAQAIKRMKAWIPKGCYHYIVTQPSECVKYDCN